MIPIPQDFKEFLKCLNDHHVEYLVIGDYAVAFYGHPRYTGDIDVWVRRSGENAGKIVCALREFGFDTQDLAPDLFTKEDSVVRMGVPPLRIEILNKISGIEFEPCFERRTLELVDDTQVPFIDLVDLKANKKASGRNKDLADLDSLQ